MAKLTPGLLSRRNLPVLRVLCAEGRDEGVHQGLSYKGLVQQNATWLTQAIKVFTFIILDSFGVFINTMKENFIFKFWFLTSFYKITILQVKAENWLLLFVSIFWASMRLKAWYKSKLKWKVVFLVLTYTMTTVK